MSSSDFTSTLVFFVNGKKVTVDNVDPSESLLSYIRCKLQLTGTKIACGEGGCGSCTLMLSTYDRQSQEISHIAINACITPVITLHGKAITTIEGIGSTKEKLHVIQDRIATFHGLQCGFCTPGMVMSMYALLRSKNTTTKENGVSAQPVYRDVERALQGNLCRCTGYRPILDGFETLAVCCKKWADNKQTGSCCMLRNDDSSNRKLCDGAMLPPFDPKQEPIFPPELQIYNTLDLQFLKFTNGSTVWYRPVNMLQLTQLLLQCSNTDTVMLAGCTLYSSLIEKWKKCDEQKNVILLSAVLELSKIVVTQEGVTFGACCTMSQIEEKLQELVTTLPKHKRVICEAFLEMLRWFGNPQVRNVATIGGNIMSNSGLSDFTPLLMTCNAVLNMMQVMNGSAHEYNLPIRQGVKHNQKEILTSVFIPFPNDGEYYVKYFKQARCRDVDATIVNAAFLLKLAPGTNLVEKVDIAYGGLPPDSRGKLASMTMSALEGKAWEESMIPAALDNLLRDFTVNDTSTVESYKKLLVHGLFYKFFTAVKHQIENGGRESDNVDEDLCYPPDGNYSRELSRGRQEYEEEDSTQPKSSPIRRPLPHLSARQLASGEAVFLDDMPRYKGELFLAFVTSDKAHARILSVDASESLKLPGVRACIDHRDVPGSNWTTLITEDEPLFALDEVTCQGQVIAAIVADNRTLAKRAAGMVRIEYEELPALVTIEDAIAANSFHDFSACLTNGDVVEGFKQSDHVIEGEVKSGSQEHFYLETHGAIAVPSGEDGELEVYASTQNITKLQKVISTTLNVPRNRLTIKTKRVGGGFGGKDVAGLFVPMAVSVAASKLGRPIRCILDRGEDMIMTGGRHPTLGRYKVGFSNEGKIIALSLKVYGNFGNFLGKSALVMQHLLLSAGSAYSIPNVSVSCFGCKTNIASNTAFRGFGKPQAIFLCEQWMMDVALTAKLPAHRVREINLHKEGDHTFDRQVLSNCTLPRCWQECTTQSNYVKRRQAIDALNGSNKFVKRGLAMAPVMYGMCYPERARNQGACLLHVYTDGSVLLAHGGVEMGQGLHTKMAAVAAHTLGVPSSLIHISETSTATVPNTTATSASVSSDLNGFAVVNACEILLTRLTPYKKQSPGGSWIDWVRSAYFDRVSLSTTGFYASPIDGFNFETGEGRWANYYTYGVSCCEVEVDCLTGSHTLLRTDIVMDVGRSVNPAIDIGQIEGGFVQGYGYLTIEEHVYSREGRLLTHGPGTYKIPTVTDIPTRFNISLLKGVEEPKAILSSKGIGEPSLILAVSAFLAIKDAVISARRDVGLSDVFRMDAPATVARIRLACGENVRRDQIG